MRQSPRGPPSGTAGARDGERLQHQGARRLRRGLGDAGEQGRALPVGGIGAGLGVGIGRASEIIHATTADEGPQEATLLTGRHAKRGENRHGETHIAAAQDRIGQAEQGGCLQRQREHFRIGGGAVFPAERFDARLQELAAVMRTVPEDGADIAVLRRRARQPGGEIIAADRNRIFRAQAHLASRAVAREEHAAADVLARQVEERLGRLQDGRLDAPVAGAREQRAQRLGRVAVDLHAVQPPFRPM